MDSKASDSLVKLQANSLNKSFEDANVDPVVLDKQITQALELLESTKIIGMDNNEIKTFFDSASSWILKNFSSPKLNTVINLISVFLHKIGYKLDIKREDIIRLLELETYEKMMKNTEDKEKNKNADILSQDSIISNQFLSTFYALIITIANKPTIIIKSKNLLKSIINVLSQISEIDNIAIYYKKKRLIKVFSKILKELKNSKEGEESFINLSKTFMFLFAKIGKKRPVYRDYMFKKSIPDLVIEVITNYQKTSKEFDTLKVFCIYTFFSIRTVDHKTYFWTMGVTSILLEQLYNLVKNESLFKFDETHIECITLALYYLTLDNSEVQNELKDSKFLDFSKELLVKYSKNNFIIYNVVSIIRRIKDEDNLSKIAEDFLYTFFALFDYFYLMAKQYYKDNKPGDNCELQFELLIIKEIIAILGNISKNESHSKPFIEKSFHLVLIDVKLSFHFYPKLIKNSIGALINLTTCEEIRDHVSQLAAFSESIYLILDTYQSNQAIIDYELKLIINVLKNNTSLKTFICGDLFYFLFQFLKEYSKNEEIIFNSIKIIRTLTLKKKGYDEFITKLNEYYKTVINSSKENELKDNINQFINELISILEQKYQYINICIEVFLLISYLTNQDENFKSILEFSDNFMNIIQKIISNYSNDENISKLISQCIAQLPIEDFYNK